MQDADDQRNYVLDNSRGYQTRGRSLGQGRATMNSMAMKTAVGVPEENLQLVPCRWSHTGWKYVQKPTAKTNFFTSPNRVNSHGFAATGQVVHQNTAGRQSNKDASNFVTSYGDQFNPKK